MAEYITKEQALETECEKCPVYDCLFHCPTYNALNNLQTADVLERSEYERLLKENERLRGDLEFKSEAINLICEKHKEYVSKIDKAIEEIEGEYLTCNLDWIDGLHRALEILKRNIGE